MTVLTADERLEYLPAYMTGGWKPRMAMGSQMMMPEPDFLKDAFQVDMRVLKALVRTNAQIIAGTDYPNPWAFPGFSLHDELEIYVQAGMSPLQALQTATINPSIVMNNQKIGRVEKGALASLVLLNTNPLEDINAVRDIESVILRGRAFHRDELNAMLAKAKRKVALPDARKLIEDMEARGNFPESLLALQNQLDSLAEKYHLSGLEMTINRLGYRYLRVQDFESALKVFELNTRLYSHSQNVWDSYAEGFLTQGDTAQAIIYYQKALDIYPCSPEVERRLLALNP
ncbi:MAG: amidohydrolase family protein [Cyclobacteriaceae bacterium]|nr:amidohydrolase family protein [Cyclobacteriaceae bacterium]